MFRSSEEPGEGGHIPQCYPSPLAEPTPAPPARTARSIKPTGALLELFLYLTVNLADVITVSDFLESQGCRFKTIQI